MQLVAPSAVRMADATDAMICTIHFSVSFLVMVYTPPFCQLALSVLLLFPGCRRAGPVPRPQRSIAVTVYFPQMNPRGRLAQAPLLDPPQPPPGAHVSQTHPLLHSLRGIADLLRARRALTRRGRAKFQQVALIFR